MLGGGVSHPSQLTTGLVIKSVTTSPTLAGERMLFILQVSILSEQIPVQVVGWPKKNQLPVFLLRLGDCSPTDKANLFGSYFSANSSLSDSNAPDPPTQPLSNPILSIIISACKVRQVLRSLKTDKASDPDGIPPRFLKEFVDELAPVLCHLFSFLGIALL